MGGEDSLQHRLECCSELTRERAGELSTAKTGDGEQGMFALGGGVGIHIMELSGESWILENGSYYASEMGVEVDTHREKALTAFKSGERFLDFQTKISGNGRAIMVIDVGLNQDYDPGLDLPVVFPGPGQTDVPRLWYAYETPDPVPGVPNPVGSPLTVSFLIGQSVQWGAVTLVSAGGTAVDIILA